MNTKEVIEQGDALLNRIDYMRIYGIEAGTLILERENTIKNFIAALKQSQAKVDAGEKVIEVAKEVSCWIFPVNNSWAGMAAAKDLDALGKALAVYAEQEKCDGY